MGGRGFLEMAFVRLRSSDGFLEKVKKGLKQKEDEKMKEAADKKGDIANNGDGGQSVGERGLGAEVLRAADRLLGVPGLTGHSVTHTGGVCVLWHNDIIHRKSRQRPGGGRRLPGGWTTIQGSRLQW